MGCFPDSGGADAGDAGGDGMADTDGGMEEQRYFVQIKDVTRNEAPEGDRVCDAGENQEIDTAGIDLGGIALLDENGETVAWGTDDIVNRFTNVSKYAGDNQAKSILDGTAPELDDAEEGGVECPVKFGSEHVVSLGCKGSVVVGFQNDSGEWVPIEDGYELQVYEYAKPCFQCHPNCDDTAEFKEEALEIKVCEPTSDAESQKGDLVAASFGGDGNLSQCSESLTIGTGAVVRASYP